MIIVDPGNPLQYYVLCAGFSGMNPEEIFTALIARCGKSAFLHDQYRGYQDSEEQQLND